MKSKCNTRKHNAKETVRNPATVMPFLTAEKEGKSLTPGYNTGNNNFVLHLEAQSAAFLSASLMLAICRTHCT